MIGRGRDVRIGRTEEDRKGRSMNKNESERGQELKQEERQRREMSVLHQERRVRKPKAGIAQWGRVKRRYAMGKMKCNEEEETM